MGEADGPDTAASTLQREIYWARAGVKRVRADTLWVRDQLSTFALQRRTEESEVRPLGDPTLESRSDARKALKFGIWRVVRFATRRYDRLLGELAELTTSLAERVIAAEDEMDRLRAEVQELRRDGS